MGWRSLLLQVCAFYADDMKPGVLTCANAKDEHRARPLVNFAHASDGAPEMTEHGFGVGAARVRHAGQVWYAEYPHLVADIDRMARAIDKRSFHKRMPSQMTVSVDAATTGDSRAGQNLPAAIWTAERS